MAKFVWTDQLNVGIDVIDQQHRRIVEYINQLDDAPLERYVERRDILVTQ